MNEGGTWSRWCPPFLLRLLASIFDLPHVISSCWIWAQSRHAASSKYQKLKEDDGSAFLSSYRPLQSQAVHSSSAGVEVCKWKPPAGPKAVIVMRHGHRQDEDDPRWSATAPRPWDPPLSLAGRKGVQEAASALAEQQPRLQIEYVVTSPFLRCLQTSTEIVTALKLPPRRWLVDWGMAEMCDPRLLVGSRPDVANRVAGQPIAEWMWGGMNMQEALFHFTSLARMASGSSLRTEPVELKGRPVPTYPETPEQAVARYTAELDWIMQGGGGFLQGNVLVVTHGEAVRTAVTMQQPDAIVYEVNHCAYALLRRHTVHTHGTLLPGQHAKGAGPIRRATSAHQELIPPWQEPPPSLQQSPQSPRGSHNSSPRRARSPPPTSQQPHQKRHGEVVVHVDGAHAPHADASAAVHGPTVGSKWSLASTSGETGVSWLTS